MQPDRREPIADVATRSWWRFTLPPPLEARFTRETNASRNADIRYFVGIELIYNTLMFGADLWMMPEIWVLCLLLRLLVLLPVCLLARHLLIGERPPWLSTLASIGPHITAMVMIMTLYAVSDGFDALRSVVVLSMGIIWVCVLVPMRMWDAIQFVCITLFLGDAVTVAGVLWHNAPIGHPDVMFVSHYLAVQSLLARVVGERQSRAAFMLGLRLQSRADDLARSNAKLLAMSNTDPLTGLANRRFFDESLEQAWQTAAAKRRPLSLMMVDVDHFKKFNDAAGHLEGDRCLTTVAHCIADHVRAGRDLVGRFGGEEFVVLMPDTDAAGSLIVAERARNAIAALKLFHPGRIGQGCVSVSIGVATLYPALHPGPPAKLVEAADNGLYAAKDAGRDRVMSADHKPNTEAAA